MKLYRLNREGSEASHLLPELSQLPYNCIRCEKDIFCLTRELNGAHFMKLPPEVISLYYDVVEEKNVMQPNGRIYHEI